MQDPIEHRNRFGEVELCWFEWNSLNADNGNAGNGTILLLHATGFHARCWNAVVALLGERHVIALDLRGHGRSANTGPFDWGTFGADVTRFIRELDLRNLTAAGHSMGGHCLVQAASVEEDRFTRLLLVDPVILDPAAYTGEMRSATWSAEGEHPVARRKNRFADAQAMIDNFTGRGSYGLWRPEVLRDYCVHGLLPAADGEGFELACPPAVEASIYTGSAGLDIHALVRGINLPVTVMRAPGREADSVEMDFSKSPTWAGLAGAFPHGTEVFLPDLTHFIPMQAPALVAQYLLDDGAPPPG